MHALRHLLAAWFQGDSYFACVCPISKPRCVRAPSDAKRLKTQQDNVWDEKPITNAHQIGCNAVSWAPAAAPGSATGANAFQVQGEGVIRIPFS